MDTLDQLSREGATTSVMKIVETILFLLLHNYFCKIINRLCNAMFIRKSSTLRISHIIILDPHVHARVYRVLALV